MNLTETADLCQVIAHLCPSQRFERNTPHAWQVVLDDVRFDDAQTAVRTLYREFGRDDEYGQRKIEADDVLRQVRRLRRDRLDRHPYPIPPPDLSPAEEFAWLRTARRRIGDGETVVDDQRGQLVARPVAALLAGANPKGSLA